MTIDDADLTAKAKIRNAAFKLFSEVGFAAASIRLIAAEAGVSLGLVRYHFGSKEALRADVDTWVISTFDTPIRAIPDGTPLERLSSINQAFADVMKTRSGFDGYLRRAFLEDSPASASLFDGLLDIVRQLIDRSKEDGSIPAERDTEWMPYQILFLHLGPLLLRPYVERHFETSIYAPETIDKRSRANLDLFRYGLGGVSPPPAPRKPTPRRSG